MIPLIVALLCVSAFSEEDGCPSAFFGMESVAASLRVLLLGGSGATGRVCAIVM